MKLYKLKAVFVLLAAIIVTSFIFNKYAYEILEFNADFRVLIKNGTFKKRDFTHEGLPVSNSPRIGEFVSPFYVVHYGLIYSSHYDNKFKGEHWEKDSSLEYWNVHPDFDSLKNEEYFYNTARWLVDNLEMYKGGYHYLYKFDWPYKNYPSGKLSADWWSGLTDGYAIILLLRAYDYFNEPQFKDAADKIYSTLLNKVEQGGSVNYLNNDLWIEEYVDPRFKGSEMSYVLNGMIYASYGVSAYESYFLIKDGYKDKLAQSILNNLSRFDLDGWSSYDLIGNSNNVKYHNIHYILLVDLIAKCESVLCENNLNEMQKSWKNGFENPGFYFLIKGPISFAYFHFIASFIIILMVLIACFFWLKRND